MSDDARLSATYDHYKDTFQRIREREKQRDRLFLWLVGLLGILFLFADHPGPVIELIAIVAKFDVPKIDLPGPIIASALWTFLFVASLRYLQAGIHVDRQYAYLHGLEDKLALQVGDDALFRREGRAYGQSYPAFSNWTWVVYAFVFPTLFVLTTTILILREWPARTVTGGHFWYDLVIFSACNISFVLRVIHNHKSNS